MILNIFDVTYVHVSLLWCFSKCSALIKSISIICTLVKNAHSGLYSRLTTESEALAMGISNMKYSEIQEPLTLRIHGEDREERL